MIYSYLSDGALSPLLSKAMFNGNEIFGSYENAGGTSIRSGVCQLDERVLSIFNNDESATPNTGLNRQYHYAIRDPRGTTRRQGLFTGDASYVSGTGQEYAYGIMELHFDKYWAQQESASEPGNRIYELNDAIYVDQFTKLFNVIETVVLSHTYDPDPSSNFWRYKTAEELDSILRSNSTLFGLGSVDPNDVSSGYVPSTLSLSLFSTQNKRATVQNKGQSNVVKTAIGTNNVSMNSPVVFPDFLQFQFRFSGLTAATWFRIYLNPDYLLSNYSRCRITNIICPTNPTAIADPSYSNIYDALKGSSSYVANVLTGEITKSTTDPMLTTSHTGVVSFTTKYYHTTTDTYDYTFSCVYKGRKPTAAEMRDAIRVMLENATSAAVVKERFKDLYVTTSFIIIPQYDTRVTTDTAAGVTYCRNIVNFLQILKNYNGRATTVALSGVPTPVQDTSSIMNVAGYLMHLLVYSQAYDTTTQAPVTLDGISVFQSYQPISTTNGYWGTMSDEARELNSYLSKIIAAEINNTAIPSEITYYTEPKEVFSGQGNRTYITFAVGGYSFSLMTKESYMNGL